MTDNNTPVKRGRGRPKGSKDTYVRMRTCKTKKPDENKIVRPRGRPVGSKTKIKPTIKYTYVLKVYNPIKPDEVIEEKEFPTLISSCEYVGKHRNVVRKSLQQPDAFKRKYLFFEVL